MAEQIRRFWNVTHVVHVHYDLLIASTFAKTSEMIFHDVSSMFCSSCCNSKYLVRDKYFGAQVCTAGWHTLALRCFLHFYGLFFQGEESKHTFILIRHNKCLISIIPTLFVSVCHCSISISFLSQPFSVQVHRLLARQSWSFDGSCEEETMRWFQHLEAATHQSRSARDVLREVPLLSVLVIEINSR